MSVGIEVNPLAETVSPLANWRVIPENAMRPAVMVGTSSDRIGTPSGQSYFVTASKDVSRWLRMPVAPYVGVAYGTHEDRARVIGGLNLLLPSGLSSLVIYDGVKVHPTLSWTRDRHSLTFLLAHGQDPGVSYSLAF